MNSSLLSPASRIKALNKPRPSSACRGAESRRPEGWSKIIWLPSVWSQTYPILLTALANSSPDITGRRVTKRQPPPLQPQLSVEARHAYAC